MTLLEQIYSTFTRFTLEETEQSVGQRFEKIALLHGERLAITDSNASISYGALNQLANRMARTILEAVPATRPARIAICMEKGIQHIAAILAVLKCGHTYVPIDPDFPAARNRHIYRETKAELLLTNDAHRNTAAELAGNDAQILNLDELPERVSGENLDISVSPDALAYIIYTSGSTGQPKGVIQNHRNLLHGCMRRTNLQKVSPRDRMTLFYSCSVIASVYCIFGALLNGAALFPYDFRIQGVANLADWLRSRGITIYHSIASVFREFARDYHGPEDVFDIRLVTFGGERVLTSDVELARRTFSRDISFYTGLGSTETGTMRYFPIGPETELQGEVVPLGYPVEGMDVLLLDENGNEVVRGEVGEITVRSRYLALGYWNNREASDRVFTADPEDPELRLYHTGDLGQMEEDGLLYHRGRKDFQVKIRGFRVEVGEVEARLLDQPCVADAVVVARDVHGEQQLVAYLVAVEGADLTVEALRSALSEHLNYYMIPTVMVQLECLPKTPNNKVDRNALPDPDARTELSGAEVQPAQSETECRLVEFCRQVLERDIVGINQNFFDLGGHSLSATRLLARINEHFGVHLEMRSIFETRDLRALAAEIDAADRVESPLDADGPAPAPLGARLPVSPAQQRMWLADRMYGSGAAYNIANCVYIEGELNISALEQALTMMVDRHAILRTRFPADEEGPRQQVLLSKPVRLDVKDLSRLEKTERASRALRICRQLLAQPQDLEQGPLFQAALLRLGERSAILSLVFNHIIYDNIWSSAIFFRELGALYQAACHDEPAPLAPLELQFGDYTYWSRQRDDSTMLSAQLDFWRAQLAAAPEALDFPADHPRPLRPDFSGGLVRFKLPASVWSAVQELAQRESVTTFMVLLAAWQLLLHRYSGQDDILVGTPSGRRHHSCTENMIGLFINTLVMRTDFSGQPDFHEVLQRVRDVTIDAFSNDRVPYEEVVQAVNPVRNPAVTPLFQHLFIHRRIDGDPWKIPDLKVKRLDVHGGFAKFELTLSVLEADGGLSGNIEYSRARFERQSVESLARNFVQLLASAVAQPGIPIANLAILDESERERLVSDGNDTDRAFPRDATVAQLFERQVQLSGDREALLAGEVSLTYHQLNARANTLAHALIQRGTLPGDLVAVCLERGADLVAALLAIWKVGAAFVPLDPHFPPQRLQYMLEDSATRVLITSDDIHAQLDHFHGDVVLPTQLRDVDGGRDPGALLGAADDLAYVIYTSGSTGNPKGVQISQRSLVNFLTSMQVEPGFTASDRLLAVTTVCFDIALLELFLPLVCGGSLVLQDRRSSLDPRKLAETLEHRQVTVMQATPATWRMMLDHGWQGRPGLRVLCGGEAMGRDLAQRLLALDLDVWNMYGPTETTIWSSVGKISRAEDAGLVGSPIANTRFFVLSDAGELQPTGVPGELCIGGAGLARGYLNRPELSAEKFIPHPLDPDGRLYRTGDRVVRRADGRIEFMGRIDHQVKIRGYRVEVGEIEAAMIGNDIRRAAVIAHDDDSGAKYLVAYLIAAEGTVPDIAALRQRLCQTLPDYMVPSQFVELREFPLTANGKVDRKAFAPPVVEEEPEPVATSANDEVTPERAAISETADTVREAVLKVFASVLKAPVTDTAASFFDLGGHSLAALNAIARLNSRFALDMPPTLLFDFPSVEALTNAVRQFLGGESAEQVIATASQDVEDDARVEKIIGAVQSAQQRPHIPPLSYGLHMRESEVARLLLAPLYRFNRKLLRTFLKKLILKLEGGSTLSVTMRKLFRQYYDIDVADFSSVPFDVMRLKESTTVGRFSTIYPTVQFQTADHPRNTLSTHGIFYHSGFGFSRGYQLDRVKVEVGNDVWIADGAKILYPTKKIGDGAVIAAGSVVIEDVPPYAIVAGYPARVVRYRFARKTIDKLLKLKWWNMPVNQLYLCKSQFLEPLEGDKIR